MEKRVFVTGAASGIGKAIVETFCMYGAKNKQEIPKTIESRIIKYIEISLMVFTYIIQKKRLLKFQNCQNMKYLLFLT